MQSLANRVVLLSLMLVVGMAIHPVKAEKEDGRWIPYLEYFDPTRRMIFICYYDPRRIDRDPGLSKLAVWEKMVPLKAEARESDGEEGDLPIDTTSLYEIDCEEKKYRVLETYSHYDNVVRYHLASAPWHGVRPGTSQEHLLHTVCVRSVTPRF